MRIWRTVIALLCMAGMSWGQMEFDGSNDMIIAPIGLATNSSVGTWATWINFGGRNTSLAYQTILSAYYTKGAIATSVELTISDYTGSNTNLIYAYLRIGGSTKWSYYAPANSANNLKIGVNQVVMVQDGTNPKLYVNGESLTFTFVSGTDKTAWLDDLGAASPAIDSFMLSGVKYNNTLYYPFIGKIYQTLIFPTALTDSEVRNLYVSNGTMWPSNVVPVAIYKGAPTAQSGATLANGTVIPNLAPNAASGTSGLATNGVKAATIPSTLNSGGRR